MSSLPTINSKTNYPLSAQQPITLYFDNDDMKCNIIYSPEMQPLYELYEEPPKAFGGRPPIHIYRLTPGLPGVGSQFQRTEIMFIRWNHIGRKSQITFSGDKTTDLSDMFPRTRKIRRMMSPIGELECRDVSRPSVPALYDMNGNQLQSTRPTKRRGFLVVTKVDRSSRLHLPRRHFSTLSFLAGW
ncbi:hypothetical protein DL93DRAFT_2227368 [Clavulina sp. PMI_390]|nr:hypothetical protein DL93DRAFT_2227368 [Clavulina sp. PMI_390]